MELLSIFIGPTYKVDKLSGSSPLIVYRYSGLEISSTISTSIELENNVCTGLTIGVFKGTFDAKSSKEIPKYILLFEFAEISLVSSKSVIVL